MNSCQIVILAAGKGTRMESDLPKVLVELSGKPLISHLLQTVDSVSEKPAVIVVGYKKELVQSVLGDKYVYVEQTEQKGTAHATGVALPQIDADNTLVLYGDMPFIKPETITALAESHAQSQAPLTIATTTVPDFSDWHAGFERFGRIIREDGDIVGIKEFKDASDEQKQIKEVNPAYFLMNTEWARGHIGNIDNHNAQGELYLTDLVKIAVDEGSAINSISIDPHEALGANTVDELKVLEKFV